MNTTRAIIDLRAIRNLNQVESMIFSIFFGQKGRYFTTEKIFEKIGEHLVDKEAEDAAKEEKAAKSKITRAINKLVEANVVVQKAEQPASEPKEFTIPEYDIKDLREEQQILIGGKEHTTLTANGETVHYGGDVILYMCHPLSPEYKAGQRIGTATLKDFHVNEEGFKYGIVQKPVMKEGEKPKSCAVKLSQAQLLDVAIPEGAKEVVKYKKKANLTKPELQTLPNLEEGSHVLFFNAIWSPTGNHMSQILEGLKENSKELKDMSLTSVNTDHQVDACKAYVIRTAPTLVVVKDGKEVSRMEGFPTNVEDPNKEIYSFLKKALK
jgi:hypothetical protein